MSFIGASLSLEPNCVLSLGVVALCSSPAFCVLSCCKKRLHVGHGAGSLSSISISFPLSITVCIKRESLVVPDKYYVSMVYIIGIVVVVGLR